MNINKVFNYSLIRLCILRSVGGVVVVMRKHLASCSMISEWASSLIICHIFFEYVELEFFKKSLSGDTVPIGQKVVVSALLIFCTQFRRRLSTPALHFQHEYPPSNTVLSTVHQQRFRFLDLSSELRRCVYENIKFPTT